MNLSYFEVDSNLETLCSNLESFLNGNFQNGKFEVSKMGFENGFITRIGTKCKLYLEGSTNVSLDFFQ